MALRPHEDLFSLVPLGAQHLVLPLYGFSPDSVRCYVIVYMVLRDSTLSLYQTCSVLPCS